MDISKHINLIENHSYKGKIGILKADAGIFHRKGDVILFRASQYDEKSCVIECPYSEEDIQEKRATGSGIDTFATCVGVPYSIIEEITVK